MSQQRTGRRQAAIALRSLGLRVAARLKLSPGTQEYLTSADAYVVVPFRQGLTDEKVTSGDIITRCASLTDVVRWADVAKVEGKTASDFRNGSTTGKAEGEVTTGSDRTVRDDSGEAVTDTGSVPGDTQTGSEGEGETSDGDAPPTPAPGSMEAALQATIASVAKAQLDAMVKDAEQAAKNAAEAAINRANDVVGAMIQKAVEDATDKVNANAVQKIEVVIPTLPNSKEIEGEHKQFADLLRLMGAGCAVFAAGPSGSGKTTAMIHAADVLGLEYFVQRPIQDSFDVSGFVDANGNYQASPVYRWAKSKGALLIVDEMDRSNPNAMTSMHTVCNGVAVFPHEQVSIDPSNMICATGNTWGIGPDAEYTGSARLDAATLNRFDARMTWEYDEALEQRMVVAFGCEVNDAKIAQQFRKRIADRGLRIIWSPRDTVSFCKRITYANMSIAESASFSVLHTMRSEEFAELTAGLI